MHELVALRVNIGHARTWMVAAGVLAFAGLGLRAVCAPALEHTTGYFPASLRAPSVSCRDWPRPEPAVNVIEAEWYPRQWKAAGERSLFQESRLPDSPRHETYRFTWLRSFHAPVIVRLDQAGNGDLHLTAKKLSGRGGDDPGVLAAIVERNLTINEKRQFYRALSQANGLRIPARNCQHGFDGAVWIMEANDRGIYRYVNRWTPEDGPIRNLGLTLLGFTPWRLDPIY